VASDVASGVKIASAYGFGFSAIAEGAEGPGRTAVVVRAGCLIRVIFDRRSPLCVPVHVRFAPGAIKVLIALK
jgi:hypothetical protein